MLRSNLPDQERQNLAKRVSPNLFGSRAYRLSQIYIFQQSNLTSRARRLGSTLHS